MGSQSGFFEIGNLLANTKIQGGGAVKKNLYIFEILAT